MGDMMTFPASVEEFMEQYKMTDTEHVYSNGTEYVPIYRMKQWFEHCRNQQKPTIDAVEVVQCDKCKHFKHDEANDEWYCKKSGADIEYVDSLTHFCSYGDRK